MERDVGILGIPTDYGTNRRGVDMGPSVIRYAGLAGELESADASPTDAGDLAVPHHVARDADAGATNTKHVKEVEEVTRSFADAVLAALVEGTTPFAPSSDHSIAIGSLVDSARGADVGVIWLDTHGDFNAPSISPPDNIHGMSLAVALGIGNFAGVGWVNIVDLKEENVAIVGLHSIDDAEAEAIRDNDVTAYTMLNINERDITDVTNDVLDVATSGTDGVHIGLDFGWLDSREASGVRTPIRSGVTYREAHAAVELVAHSKAMRPFELVEINPIPDEHNETATLATELVASTFGKRIL